MSEDKERSVVVRYTIWTSDGEVSESLGAAPRISGALVFTVMGERVFDSYMVQGSAGEPLENPFAIEVHPSGALVIKRTDNQETLRIYAPGHWQDLEKVVPEWSGDVMDPAQTSDPQ